MTTNHTDGRLFIKDNKVVKESIKFIYEKCIYVIYPLSVNLIDSKILESSNFLEDSSTYKLVKDQRLLITFELIAAPISWINNNQFLEYLKKSRKKTK